MSRRTAALLRAARIAGARGDRDGLRAAAKAWVAEAATEGAWWAGDEARWDGQFDPAEAGLLIIAEEGHSVGVRVGRRLLFADVAPNGEERIRPLKSVPVEELDNFSLRDLGWLRLLTGDLRPLPPPHRGRGKLSGRGRRADRLLRKALLGLANRDASQVAAAMREAASLEKSRRFSFLAYAIGLYARRIGIDPGMTAYDF